MVPLRNVKNAALSELTKASVAFHANKQDIYTFNQEIVALTALKPNKSHHNKCTIQLSSFLKLAQ